jgi:hypothetical protein
LQLQYIDIKVWRSPIIAIIIGWAPNIAMNWQSIPPPLSLPFGKGEVCVESAED